MAIIDIRYEVIEMRVTLYAQTPEEEGKPQPWPITLLSSDFAGALGMAHSHASSLLRIADCLETVSNNFQSIGPLGRCFL